MAELNNRLGDCWIDENNDLSDDFFPFSSWIILWNTCLERGMGFNVGLIV